MNLTWLQPAVTGKGPFTTVHLDVTRTGATSPHDIEVRWQGVRDELASGGVPKELLDDVARIVLEPTGRAGEHGRSVVAGPDGVVLDRVLSRAPLRTSCHHGLVAHLMPLVRAMDGAVRYVLVEVDRAGADVHVVDPLADTREDHSVEGGHDVLHPVPGGGMSHRRFRSRVHDSWERNAEAVAKDVDKVVAEHQPEVVLVSGDPKALAELTGRLGQPARERLSVVDGGGRSEGVDDAAFAHRVADSLRKHRQVRMGDAVARYEQAAGQDSGAAAGLAATVEALRAGAVEVLLLHDDPSSTLTLWAGEDPLHLGTSREDVQALGAERVEEDRADAVLLRALVAQHGDVELVDTPDVLPGGVGAVLRFDVRPAVPGAGA
ncbi:baeRF2 domain-containing protein [Thalassiella azotivora]